MAAKPTAAKPLYPLTVEIELYAPNGAAARVLTQHCGDADSQYKAYDGVQYHMTWQVATLALPQFAKNLVDAIGQLDAPKLPQTPRGWSCIEADKPVSKDNPLYLAPGNICGVLDPNSSMVCALPLGHDYAGYHTDKAGRNFYAAVNDRGRVGFKGSE